MHNWQLDSQISDYLKIHDNPKHSLSLLGKACWDIQNASHVGDSDNFWLASAKASKWKISPIDTPPQLHRKTKHTSIAFNTIVTN